LAKYRFPTVQPNTNTELRIFAENASNNAKASYGLSCNSVGIMHRLTATVIKNSNPGIESSIICKTEILASENSMG